MENIRVLFEPGEEVLWEETPLNEDILSTKKMGVYWHAGSLAAGIVCIILCFAAIDLFGATFSIAFSLYGASLCFFGANGYYRRWKKFSRLESWYGVSSLQIYEKMTVITNRWIFFKDPEVALLDEKEPIGPQSWREKDILICDINALREYSMGGKTRRGRTIIHLRTKLPKKWIQIDFPAGARDAVVKILHQINPNIQEISGW